MAAIPRDPSLDSSLALLRDGYTFISGRCQRLGADAFITRFMLKEAVCMVGGEAAEQFYVPGRFTRRGAMPPTTLWLLQDTGSVQQLDGEAHRWRKQMFLSLMTPSAIARLADTMEDLWRMRMRAWEGMGRVVLDHEMWKILTRAVCAWAGLPLTQSEAKRRTRELWAMVDGAGAIGPRALWGLWQRAETERWARGIIDQVRSGTLEAAPDTAVHVIAGHRDPDGNLLDAQAAVVELLNVLRPTAAVARYITFVALALHEHPRSRRRIQDGDAAYLEWFVHEVRRFYPFFPLVAGRVRQPFAWRGHDFGPGTWVLLDLYGTNHDARIWQDAEAFRPERFHRCEGSAFNFVPQGGGDHLADNLCAGEWITIALLQRAARLLTTSMRYDVPEQDLSIDLSRMPTAPRSGFVITNVQPVAGSASASTTA